MIGSEFLCKHPSGRFARLASICKQLERDMPLFLLLTKINFESGFLITLVPNERQTSLGWIGGYTQAFRVHCAEE